MLASAPKFCEAFVPRLAALGAPLERVRVHRTGLATRDFPWRPERSGVTDGTIRFVTAARLVEKKGVDDVLDAVRRLRAGGLDVRYRIIGDGPLRTRLAQRATELGLDGTVDWLGWQSPAQARALIADSDVVVQASVTSSTGDQEGIPNVLKEAMLLGLPVVATRHSGIPELVTDGSTGYLVPERDPAALAAALARLVAERARWPEMGRAGRRVVERDYDIEVLNDRFVALLEEAVARAAGLRR